MAALFMNIYDLAILTFMFVRNKNSSPECNNMFGPDSEDIKNLEKQIDSEDHSSYISKGTLELISDGKNENSVW